ncbi:MAG TPA: prephenate dehydratase, partial [Solirubrobacteraceae bacterium]|jgi:prephenate dehydratase|nr:prephenate dehydratase [Solirubrobacteraceae bacterium]
MTLGTERAATRDGAPRVAYLGPEGTFSEEAVLASARDGAVAPAAVATIPESVAALRSGDARWAVVPIENSLEGSITVTLDLLAGDAADVQIVAELPLRVRHFLIAREPVELERIDSVLTHPAVPGQCTRFLGEQLPRAEVLAASSTAEAVRAVVADGRPGRAAIGTRLAAEIYGGAILREGIQDRDDNETRFVWLARAGEQELPPLPEPASPQTKTTLLFWGAGAARPGWLLRCLEEFADREINLTKIESRPLRRGLGAYMFFVDVLGDSREGALKAAIEALGRHCEEVRVLGSYRTHAAGSS